MTHTQLAELHNLPKKEKIELVQLLWEDIAKEQEYNLLPADHKLILNERLEKIARGKTSFISWEEVRRKYIKSDEL
jgi:putative addiction module component (TIGR02574 family)